jgi:hypothetical protein
MHQKKATYAVAALVLGICSIVFGCFFVGLVLGIIGLVLANKGIREFRANPERYKGYGMLSAGRITSIIGIVFGALYIVYYIIAVLILGAAGFAFMEGEGLDFLEMFD